MPKNQIQWSEKMKNQIIQSIYISEMEDDDLDSIDSVFKMNKIPNIPIFKGITIIETRGSKNLVQYFLLYAIVNPINIKSKSGVWKKRK